MPQFLGLPFTLPSDPSVSTQQSGSFNPAINNFQTAQNVVQQQQQQAAAPTAPKTNTLDPNYDIYTGTYKNTGTSSPTAAPAMGGAPTPYTWNQATANSIDPGVYGQTGFSQNQNADLLMSQVNQQNNLSYQNYQTAYQNWLQNGQKGPMPQAPSYAQFDQNKFNQLWQQDQAGNGTGFDFTNLNSAITPGSVFANNPGTSPGQYAGGPGGTYSAGPSGINGNGVNLSGTPTGQYAQANQMAAQSMQPQGGQQQQFGGQPQQMMGGGPMSGPISNGIMGGGGQPGFGNSSFAGQQFGGPYTTFGGYNSWGSPLQGNPFAYMTGQSNNGLGGGQYNIPQGFFNQTPLSYGFGNMNPLGGNIGNLGGLVSLLNSMGGLGGGQRGGQSMGMGGGGSLMSYLAPLLGF